MNALNGYIKLHRKLVQWGWYKNSVIKDVFIHCLIMANFSEQPFEGIVIKQGQFITSYENLASDLGFSVQQVRTAIKKLKSTGEIATNSTNKFTLITVVNWEEYQVKEVYPTSNLTRSATNEQQTNNKRITNKQQSNNNNVRKIKNDNKDKNINNARARSTPYYVFNPNDCENGETPEERETRVRKLRGLE